MKAVADTLTVARSNLIERAARPTQPRRCYRKAGDEPLLVLIRRFVDERPTYGYRRITRLVNRQQKAEGKPTINAKRVLRIMQVNKLTLERHWPPARAHPRRCRDRSALEYPLVLRSFRARLPQW
jgi:putative transposase